MSLLNQLNCSEKNSRMVVELTQMTKSMNIFITVKYTDNFAPNMAAELPQVLV